jgi:transcriptional regulator with XRE-family HTH domain
VESQACIYELVNYLTASETESKMGYANQLEKDEAIKSKRKSGAGFMALETFGKRLRALRQDKNLSQIELRDKIKAETEVEIGETYISELERTSKMPSLEVAAALARVLDVTLDYLGLLIDDGTVTYRRVSPPTYFSEEADEVAQLVDHMRPEQRSVVAAVARNLAVLTTERARRQAETKDILDSVERELGRDARLAYERVLRNKGLLIGN